VPNFILTANRKPQFRIQWSHDQWRHVTRKVKVVTIIPLRLNISKIVLVAGVLLFYYIFRLARWCGSSFIVVTVNLSCMLMWIGLYCHHHQFTVSVSSLRADYQRVVCPWVWDKATKRDDPPSAGSVLTSSYAAGVWLSVWDHLFCGLHS